MPSDPTIGRVVLYRSRTGFEVPAIIAATMETLFEPGVQAYLDSKGERGVPPLSSPDHVHLVVFSPGLPQEPSPRCRNCRGPIGVGQQWADAAPVSSGGRVHLDAAECAASKGRLTDENAGGTFREWNVPLWEPRMLHSPQPGVASQPEEQPAGSWRWPVLR